MGGPGVGWDLPGSSLPVGRRKHQQYDCKWYVPLADLVFPAPEETEPCAQVHPIPDHELEDMKMKISVIKSEVQKEVSARWAGPGPLGAVVPAACAELGVSAGQPG